MNHTHGPWHANGLEVAVARHGVVGMATICYVSQLGACHPDFADEGRANARLIAAAPELLEACNSAHTVMCVEGENDLEEWREVLAAVEAAIAKAEGGQNENL